MDPKGLQVDINSSAGLNSKDGIPSSLALAFIQSNDIKALTKLMQNRVELNQMLLGEPVVNPQIISVDRFIVQASARDYVVMARRQDAKAVMVYAGYFNGPLEKSVRILEFPVVVPDSGLFSSKEPPRAGALYLFLNLADSMIDRLNLLGPDDVTFPDADDKALQGGILKTPMKGDGRVDAL